jgi:hypothetical protein
MILENEHKRFVLASYLFMMFNISSAFVQTATSPIAIPITLRVCGCLLPPDEFKLVFLDSTSNVRINSSLKLGQNSARAEFIINESHLSRVVSVNFQPTESAEFTASYCSLDSLVGANRIELEIQKVEFNHDVGWGLELGRVHNLIEAHFYFYKSEKETSKSFLYSLDRRFFNTNISRILKKCKAKKAKIAPSPDHRGYIVKKED